MKRSATPSSPARPSRLIDGGARTADERAAAALLAGLPSAAVDDHGVDRVWRAITSSGPGARSARPTLPLFVWLPAAALAAVILGVFWGSFWRSAPAPLAAVEVTFSSGGVFAARQEETWHPSRSGESLTEADRLRTDAAAEALVRIRGVAALLVGEESAVDLEQLAGGTALRLGRGTLTSRVSKRAPGEPFVVEAGRYTVKVVGTLFTVEEGPGAHTAVSVREGVVEVSRGGLRVARVVAGERWTSEDPDGKVTDRTTDAVASLLENALRGGDAAALARDFAALAKAASVPPSPVPPAPVVPLTAAAPPAPPDPMAAPLPKPAPRVSSDAVGVVAARANAFGASPVVPPAAPEVLPPPEQAPALPPPGISDAGPGAGVDPYAHAVMLEGAGDIEGAARELARAADLDPLHGDLALYSLGRLAHRRLHDPTRALAAFQRYRARYPGGALRPEVDFEILELDVEARDRSGALAESARFLADHPASERLEQVHLLRADLLRDGRKCAEAIPEYAAVRASPLADDALYSTAYCQRKLGDRAGAARTLGEYVRRFPQGNHRADALRAIESERAGESGTQN